MATPPLYFVENLLIKQIKYDVYVRWTEAVL